jgi:hypothetical protein
MKTPHLAVLQLLIALALLAPLGAPAGAAQDLPIVPAARPPAGKYLFVEVWVHVDGTGKLPALMVDFPGYSFDPATGRLAPFFAEATLPQLQTSDWGFEGRGMSRSRAAGGGVSSGLEVIAGLPYTTTVSIGTGATHSYGEQLRSAPVTLVAVAADGTLVADIDGERVVLAPGGRWSRLVTADLVNEQFDGRYLITSSVTNYGWHDRAQIAGIQWYIRLPAVLH